MRTSIALFIFTLIFSALLLLPGWPAHVTALGAPSDNTTIPVAPAGDQSQDEIKPVVEYVLLESTAQSSTAPPHFFTDFVAANVEQGTTVTGDENWYLDVDINAPGWLYIYEYFPPEQAVQGRWITYKWQLPESGQWRFGPFTPSLNEADGQHIYRLWFYSEGQWAVGNDGTSQSSLVYWEYSRGNALSFQPPMAPTEPPENGLAQNIYNFFTLPLVLAACLAAMLAGLGVLAFYLWQRRRHYALSIAGGTSRIESISDVSEPPRAKLILPNGIDIPLCGSGKVIGRLNLSRALSLDDLALISRRHFEIKSNDGRFYIEDLDSANGTNLNGNDISGKGLVDLDDNDIIEPAAAIPLKFHVL